MPYQQESKYNLSYHTGTQVSIWVGDQWIEEVFGISFAATQNIVPIFGYASSVFDAVARGKSIIRGSFDVNFTSEGYLFYLLHKYNAERTAIAEVDKTSEYALTGELPQASTEVVDRITRANDTALGQLDVAAEGETLVELIDMLANTDQGTALAIKDEINRNALLKERDPGSSRNANSIIYDMVRFDIMSVFGHPGIDAEHSTQKVLRNCYLVSNEMLIASDDQPIRERYSFIGQIHQ